MSEQKLRGKALVLSLCLADLRHERMLSLCMVLAVASVLGPLLILFGLKFGTVETLRDRLIGDPRNSEIRPLSSRSYSQEWFASMAARPDVAFVVPYTRQLAASVDLYLPGQKENSLPVDAIPTSEGDPLLLENGAGIPSLSECLLTAPAAESLGAAVGDTVILVARRSKNGRFETGERTLTVKGVLPLRAGATKAAFIPLPLLEAVESYKDGLAVPAFGWDGELPRAYPVFTSLLLQSRDALGPELEFRVINNTGFISREAVTAEEASRLTGVAPPPGAALHLLKTRGSPAGVANLRSVQYLLGGKGATLYPLVTGLTLTLEQSGEQPGTASSAPLAVLPMTPFTPLWDAELSAAAAPDRDWLHVLVSPELAARLSAYQNRQNRQNGQNGQNGASGNVTAHAEVGDNALSFPVTAAGADDIAEGTIRVSLRLAGILGLLRDRPLTFDAASDAFLLGRRGYAGFRMYASGIEAVADLKNFLEGQGVSVSTEAERIDDVLRLDMYLSLIFWLIATGSLVGGAACLLSNIYARIERKRRELAVLRLLGLSGGAFIRFPLYTAGFFATAGFALAMALFVCMATVINVLFGDHLQAGESLCRLAWWHPLVAFGLTLAVSLLAGGIAARRASSVDPAEALRNE